ncbi:MAG: energy transducer TonB [Balneola sp.]|nr:MAG: energy transducer TonB [Balneola sp.]
MKKVGKHSTLLDRISFTSYQLKFEFGLILSLGALITIFSVHIIPSETEKEIILTTQEEVIIQDIVQTRQELKAPAPPRPTVPIEVPNDEVLEEEILEIDAEIDFTNIPEIPLPPRPIDQKDIEEEEIFVVVETPPVLLGGIKAVQEKVKYPEMAVKAGIEGKVIVQFVIDKDGNVLDPFIVRGIGGGCDQEAVRVVKELKFRPGLQRGRPVSVKYTLPVTFKLKEATS